MAAGHVNSTLLSFKPPEILFKGMKNLGRYILGQVRLED
jgi:hypothetical protein